MIRAPSELRHLCVLTQEAMARTLWTLMKRLDVLMKEAAVEETFICLMLSCLACQEIESRDGREGESGEQAHLYV